MYIDDLRVLHEGCRWMRAGKGPVLIALSHSQFAVTRLKLGCAATFSYWGKGRMGDHWHNCKNMQIGTSCLELSRNNLLACGKLRKVKVFNVTIRLAEKRRTVQRLSLEKWYIFKWDTVDAFCKLLLLPYMIITTMLCEVSFQLVGAH